MASIKKLQSEGESDTCTFSPVWLELSSLARIFSTPGGDSASGVPKVPSESELWRDKQRTLAWTTRVQVEWTFALEKQKKSWVCRESFCLAEPIPSWWNQTLSSLMFHYPLKGAKEHLWREWRIVMLELEWNWDENSVWCNYCVITRFTLFQDTLPSNQYLYHWLRRDVSMRLFSIYF